MDSINNLQEAIDTVLDNTVQNQNINSFTMMNMFEKIEPPYGCKHYITRCMISAPCCNVFYPCRFCHDEEILKLPFKQQHEIDRHAINRVKCTNCNHIQDVKQICENCNTTMALYFCKQCNYFDDIYKNVRHCDKCGICRINGDISIHCDQCGICVLKNVSHKCSDKKNYNCPVCMENFFNSTETWTTLRCNHLMHVKCFYTLIDTTYKCPLCSKSMFELNKINEFIEQEVMNTIMPNEYKDIEEKILCNECEKYSNAKFHIVAMKCENCGSYNTRRIQ